MRAAHARREARALAAELWLARERDPEACHAAAEARLGAHVAARPAALARAAWPGLALAFAAGLLAGWML